MEIVIAETQQHLKLDLQSLVTLKPAVAKTAMAPIKPLICVDCIWKIYDDVYYDAIFNNMYCLNLYTIQNLTKKIVTISELLLRVAEIGPLFALTYMYDNNYLYQNEWYW